MQLQFQNAFSWNPRAPPYKSCRRPTEVVQVQSAPLQILRIIHDKRVHSRCIPINHTNHLLLKTLETPKT
jgi:hypothetical protein